MGAGVGMIVGRGVSPAGEPQANKTRIEIILTNVPKNTFTHGIERPLVAGCGNLQRMLNPY